MAAWRFEVEFEKKLGDKEARKEPPVVRLGRVDVGETCE